MMKRLLTALVLIVFVCGAAGSVYAADFKIGLVNFAKLIKESEFMAEKKVELEGKYQAERDGIEKMADDIKAMAEELQKQSMVLSQQAKEDKQIEFKRMSRDFEDQRRTYMRKVKEEEDALKETILELVFKVSNEFGKAGGYTMIMDSAMGGVVYADPALDVTEQVLVEVNRAWREGKSKGASAN